MFRILVFQVIITRHLSHHVDWPRLTASANKNRAHSRLRSAQFLARQDFGNLLGWNLEAYSMGTIFGTKKCLQKCVEVFVYDDVDLQGGGSNP